MDHGVWTSSLLSTAHFFFKNWIFWKLYLAFRTSLCFKLSSVSAVLFTDNSLLPRFLNWSQAFPLGPTFPASFSDSGCLFSFTLISSRSGDGISAFFALYCCFKILLQPHNLKNKTKQQNPCLSWLKAFNYNSTSKWSYLYITTKFFFAIFAYHH